ncbi:MAG: MFS transporter [Gammaproteobacteria bacterium]|nr:MFS transporter [Gammaproteobacteria bacterium]
MNSNPAYRYYVLGMITMTSVFSITDRLVMSILMEDIKAEFALTDTQMGLLAGVAFTMFYVIMGIPIARLADRFNRRNILSISIIVWSGMTALCGMAAGFVSLFLARGGVGIGEAGGAPPSLSIIADYFRRQELSRAMSLYSTGATMGTVTGLMAGGYFADLLGWRMTFVVLGIPGILLGIVILLTVREPRRGTFAEPGTATGEGDDLVTTLLSLARNAVYVRVALANALAIIVAYAFSIWMAPILLRNFDLSTTEVGFYLGLAFIFGGVPGLLLGGWMADYFAKWDLRWRAWLCAMALPLALPVLCLSLILEDFMPVLVAYALGYGLLVFTQGPALSVLQSSVLPAQRALATSLAFLLTNILGQAVGSLLVGSMSDSFSQEYGTQSLNYAVIVLSIFATIPAVLAYIWTGSALGKSEETPGETQVTTN